MGLDRAINTYGILGDKSKLFVEILDESFDSKIN